MIRGVDSAGVVAGGDGWIMAPFGTLEDFERGWAVARAAAQAAGRDAEALVAGRLLYVAVDEDRARAEASLTTFLHGYYGPSFDVRRHAIFGPPAEVAARLREQVDAGITELMLGVPTLDPTHLRRIAEEGRDSVTTEEVRAAVQGLRTSRTAAPRKAGGGTKAPADLNAIFGKGP